MSIIETSSIKSTANILGYVFYGRKEQIKENYRARAVFCSTSLQILKAKADILQKTKHVAPMVSIIQSFNNKQDKLDYTNSSDCKYVNDLGVELANKLYPNSDFLVVTHNDGTNHNLHNHILVLNYDYKLKHALRKNRNLYKMRHVNDELMREYGLSVVEKNKNLEKTTFETKRIASEDKNWRQHDFDTILKTKINSAKKNSKSFAEFSDLLGKDGIEVKSRTSKKNNTVGLTFKMMDNFHYKKSNGQKVLAPRTRRRKASKLGNSFSYEAILRACEANKKALEKTKREQEKKRVELIKRAQQAKKHEEQEENELRKKQEASKHVTITHFDVSKYIKKDSAHKKERNLLHEDNIKKKLAYTKNNDVFSKSNLEKNGKKSRKDKDKNSDGIDDEQEGFTTYQPIYDPNLDENNRKEAQKRLH